MSETKPVNCVLCGKMAGTASPDIQNMCVIVHTICLKVVDGVVRPYWLFPVEEENTNG